jgi:pyroglutamyl-peptidase
MGKSLAESSPVVSSSKDVAEPAESSFGSVRAAPAAVEFHCTAFGPFHNIPVNPTEVLLRSLPGHLAHRPLPAAAALASATVLETDALASLTVLERMHAKLQLPSPADGHAKAQSPTVILLHFGVDSSALRFELELQACNEANFSCPDQAGYRPVHCALDSDARLSLSHRRKTKLPIGKLAASLRMAGHDCGVSTDAGRYVCNYVYYNSLRLAEANGSLALFVHVPPHAAQSLDAQLAFFSDLVSVITALREE